MTNFIFPIKTALSFFPFIAAVLVIPLCIYQYRKNGAFLLWRAVVIYTFIFYMLCAYFLTLLPLPPVSEVVHYTMPKMQLIPFGIVRDFMQETVFSIGDPSTYLPALKQNVFTQPVFNILLVLPFGVYMRYYFNLSLRKTILVSFQLSLFYELTQLSGVYGFYPRPYRLFDVDDLMLNTLGGTLGYFITPLFHIFLPDSEDMKKRTQVKSQNVTAMRRFCAFFIDYIILLLLESIVDFFLSSLPNEKLLTEPILWFESVSYAIAVFLYFVCSSYMFKGYTLGKWIVHIKVENEDGKNSLKHLFIRYSMQYLIVFPNIYGSLFMLSKIYSIEQDNLVFLIVTAGILGIIGMVLIVHMLYCLFMRKAAIYEKVSHTRIKSDPPKKR